MKERIRTENPVIFLQVSPSLLDVPSGYCRRDLVDESRMIRIQIEKKVDHAWS
jgi:hypothetical protein